MEEDCEAKSLGNVEGTAKLASEELAPTQKDQRKPYEEPTVVFVPLEALKGMNLCPEQLNCL